MLLTNEGRLEQRLHQTRAELAEKRFNVLVWHRRAGKSCHLVSRMVARALASNKRDWQGAYVAPTRTQAAQIAEPYFLELTDALGAKYNRSEQKLQIPMVGTIRMFSGENYDRMRGLYLDDATLDECAHIPTEAWSQVISAAISDRLGGVTFAGTPNGMQNLLWRMLDYAQSSGDPEWSHSVLTWKDTGAVPEAEVERNRKAMTEEEFAQEWECSFSGALRGSYYGKEMQLALREGRVTTVRYDAALPVYGAMDLGVSDLSVMIWFQMAGTEYRILRAKAYERTGFPDMVRDWRQHEPLEEVILPHDARVQELGTGKTRQETLHSLGVNSTLCPNQGIHEGISTTRDVLRHCWFDTDGTGMLREGLQSYRAKYDEVRQVYSLKPEHSWASHWADAMRYLAVGRPALSMAAPPPRPRLRGRV